MYAELLLHWLVSIWTEKKRSNVNAHVATLKYCEQFTVRRFAYSSLFVLYRVVQKSDNPVLILR